MLGSVFFNFRLILPTAQAGYNHHFLSQQALHVLHEAHVRPSPLPLGAVGVHRTTGCCMFGH